MSISPSKELSEIRKVLEKENVSEDHVQEFFLKEEEVESTKENIRAQTNGNCYFFTRENKDNIHLIALVNLNNVADLFEKIKEAQMINQTDFRLTRDGSALNELSFLD